MAFDRSKFKPTVVAAVIEQDKELASSLGRDGGTYTKYLKFEDGNNLLRIYPAHPEDVGGGDMFAEPKVTVWLPMMVVERDSNGQEIIEGGRPKMKESSRTVFNSRIHGNTEKDLVEEYVRMATEMLEEDLKVCQDPVEKSKIEDKLHRLRGNYKLKIQGLNYKQAWVMYVDRIVGNTHTFGPIEIGPAVKDRLNSLAAAGDSGEGGVIVTDPFTDPDTGRAILVKYNSKATKPQDYYNTELDQVTIPTKIEGRTYPIPRTFPLSDDQLEQFMKVTPLAKRFKDCFTRRDFDLQSEGLQFFDAKYGIGLFQNNEFLDVYEEIDAYYPELTEENNQQGESNNEQSTTAPIQGEEVTHVEEEPVGDAFDLMTRKELGDWHKNNRTGILIKPTMSDDDIRNSARNWEYQQAEEAQVEAEQEQPAAVVEQQEQPVQQAPQATTQTTASDRIAAMRAKAGVKK